MNFEIEYITNTENKYWIWKDKICNLNSGRIYPEYDNELSCGKTVALYKVSEMGKTQIAQLAIPDYAKLKKVYEEGREINLNYMYIDEFDWLGTLMPYEVDENFFRPVVCFKSEASFWNAEGLDDFIHIMQLEIRREDMSFSYSGFYSIKLDIYNIQINAGNLTFDYARFFECDVECMCIDPVGNRYFTSEISFRYTIGNANKIQLDLLTQNCAVDFLNANLNDTEAKLYFFEKEIDHICLVKAKLKNVEIAGGRIDTLDIREANFDELIFQRVKFEGEAIIDAHLKKLKIEDSIISDVMTLNCPHALDIGFDRSVIVGKIYFRDFPTVILALKRHLKDTKRENADQLLVLKENFRQIGEYENEDLCHLQYHRTKNVFERNKIKKAIHYLLDFVCGYGIKPFRLFGSIAIIIILFSIMFYAIPAISFNNVNDFWDCLYVSGITFFTVGYGDIVPVTSVTKIAVIIEAFFGVGMMSAFLAMLTRKIIR